MPPQRLGQHFLADTSWRARILEALCPAPGDVWLEIGAGHGEMTRELARRVAHVIAIEVDAPLVRALQALAREQTNIEVVAGDVLAADLRTLGGAHSLKVYGSLPYYITSPILHRLFECAERLREIHVVIQLEVAVRLAARPGRRDYGYLSVLAQFYARPEIVFKIPPGAFRPRPRVASALVSMRLDGERAAPGIRDEAAFLRFVQACFAQKRKTLANNLRAMAGGRRVEEILAAAGLAPKARAEQLSVEQFADLYRRVYR